MNLEKLKKVLEGYHKFEGSLLAWNNARRELLAEVENELNSQGSNGPVCGIRSSGIGTIHDRSRDTGTGGGE